MTLKTFVFFVLIGLSNQSFAAPFVQVLGDWNKQNQEIPKTTASYNDGISHMRKFVKLMLGLNPENPLDKSGKKPGEDKVKAIQNTASEVVKRIVETAEASNAENKTKTIHTHILDSLIAINKDPDAGTAFLGLTHEQQIQAAYLNTYLAELVNKYVENQAVFDSQETVKKQKIQITPKRYPFVDAADLKTKLGYGAINVDMRIINFLTKGILDEKKEITDQQRRANAFSNVTDIIAQKKYINPNGFTVAVEPVGVNITASDEADIPAPTTINTPKIQVLSKDSFYAAHDLMKRDGARHVAVLNYANQTSRCGPGVQNGGSPAQEQNISSRSTLSEGLFQDVTAGGPVYPIPEFSAHFTPNVTVLKDHRFNLLNKPYKVSVITSAAYVRSTFNAGQDAEYKAKTRRKINAQLKAAILGGADSLILGAWGCGVFGNNPTDIATIYKEALETYGAYFKNITFVAFGEQTKKFQDVFFPEAK